MKIRNLLLALVALTLVSTGFVWAAGTDAEPTQAVEAQPAVEAAPADNATAAELLESLQPKADDKGACCVADCFDAWSQCMAECSDQACRIACGADRAACRQSC